MKTTIDHIAAQELELFALNDYETYSRSLAPITANMDRKRARGTFDAAKAVKAFEYVAAFAARRYAAAFGGNWCQVFNAATRRAVAVQLLQRYMIEADLAS